MRPALWPSSRSLASHCSFDCIELLREVALLEARDGSLGSSWKARIVDDARFGNRIDCHPGKSQSPYPRMGSAPSTLEAWLSIASRPFVGLLSRVIFMPWEPCRHESFPSGRMHGLCTRMSNRLWGPGSTCNLRRTSWLPLLSNRLAHLF